MKEPEAKAKLRQNELERLALQLVRRRAGEFANELFLLEPRRATNLVALAAAKKLPLKTTEPFSQYEPPKDMDVPETFNKVAFNLTDEEPLAPPVTADDGSYVMAFKQKIPGAYPTFDQVRPRVVEDYQRFRAGELAQQEGQRFAQTLTNGLAQNQTFAALCTEAKVTPVALPAFNRSDRVVPRLEGLDLSTLKEVASGLTTNQASPFIPTREGGAVVYLRSRQPVSAEQLQRELPKYLVELRRTRLYEAFGEWMGRALSEARMTDASGKQTAP